MRRGAQPLLRRIAPPLRLQRARPLWLRLRRLLRRDPRHAAAKRQLETLRETLDAYEAGAWAALDALAAAAGSSAEAVQAALLASVPALIAIPWKPHTSQAHTHALLSDIARAMGQNKL